MLPSVMHCDTTEQKYIVTGLLERLTMLGAH